MGCKVGWDEWEGSWTTENVLVSREGQNRWCFVEERDDKICYKKSGDSLIHLTTGLIAGKLSKNGDLEWTRNNNVSKLMNKCTKPKCQAKFSDLEGQKMRTWNSWDPYMKTLEEPTFIKGKLCFAKKCYQSKGNRMTNPKKKFDSGRL